MHISWLQELQRLSALAASVLAIDQSEEERQEDCKSATTCQVCKDSDMMQTQLGHSNSTKNSF